MRACFDDLRPIDVDGTIPFVRPTDDLLAKVDVLFNRLVIALIVTGVLIGSSLIGIFAKSGPHMIGVHVASALGFLLSTVLGVWLLWSVVRSGRV